MLWEYSTQYFTWRIHEDWTGWRDNGRFCLIVGVSALWDCAVNQTGNAAETLIKVLWCDLYGTALWKEVLCLMTLCSLTPAPAVGFLYRHGGHRSCDMGSILSSCCPCTFLTNVFGLFVKNSSVHQVKVGIWQILQMTQMHRKLTNDFHTDSLYIG